MQTGPDGRNLERGLCTRGAPDDLRWRMFLTGSLPAGSRISGYNGVRSPRGCPGAASKAVTRLVKVQQKPQARTAQNGLAGNNRGGPKQFAARRETSTTASLPKIRETLSQAGTPTSLVWRLTGLPAIPSFTSLSH